VEALLKAGAAADAQRCDRVTPLRIVRALYSSNTRLISLLSANAETA